MISPIFTDAQSVAGDELIFYRKDQQIFSRKEIRTYFRGKDRFRRTLEVGTFAVAY